MAHHSPKGLIHVTTIPNTYLVTFSVFSHSISSLFSPKLVFLLPFCNLVLVKYIRADERQLEAARELLVSSNRKHLDG